LSTGLALVLAMLQIVFGDLYDEAFVHRWVLGPANIVYREGEPDVACSTRPPRE
jgi:hypothetical protein